MVSLEKLSKGEPLTSGGATFAVVRSGSNPGAASWMAVSEGPPDDDSSRVTDATVNDQDRCTYPSISGSQVFGVAVNIRAEKDDSGTRTCARLPRAEAPLQTTVAIFR
jgi:hypothetical protein